MHQSYRLAVLTGLAFLPLVGFAQPLPTPTTQGVRTLLSLDQTTITSGTPVNVIAAGHAVAGGFIWTDASTLSVTGAKLCVNQKGPAGTVTGGDTMCFGAGGSYQIYPSTGAVSMSVSAGNATVAGYGFTQ